MEGREALSHLSPYRDLKGDVVMAFLDFAALKQEVRIEDAIELLQLDMKQGNNQFRGKCPACKGSGPRSLVITPAKQAFYCFAESIGGDVIALVDAAGFLVQQVSHSETGSSTVPQERIKEDARSLQPLSYLEPGHKKLAKLGLSEDTSKAFSSGYAPKGILRGRFAFPIHNAKGRLIAYGGIDPERPDEPVKFPRDFDPAASVFNLHTQTEDEILLCRSPLEVMHVHQAGIDNAVSFLTPDISSEQLLVISNSLRDRRLVLP